MVEYLRQRLSLHISHNASHITNYKYNSTFFLPQPFNRLAGIPLTTSPSGTSFTTTELGHINV